MWVKPVCVRLKSFLSKLLLCSGCMYLFTSVPPVYVLTKAEILKMDFLDSNKDFLDSDKDFFLVVS